MTRHEIRCGAAEELPARRGKRVSRGRRCSPRSRPRWWPGSRGGRGNGVGDRPARRRRSRLRGRRL